jgi:hypothetical protein
MKNLLVLILVFANSALADQPASRDNTIGTITEGTKIRPYYFINIASENDVSLDEKTRHWENIRPFFKIIDQTCNRLEFAFYVDGNTADTKYIDPNLVEFHFKIFAARRHSSAVVVCGGTAKCGELELSGEPTENHDYSLYNNGSLAENESHKWISGLSKNTDKWATPITFTDTVESDNGIARITLDTNGYASWWCEITSIKGNPGRVICVASCW